MEGDSPGATPASARGSGEFAVFLEQGDHVSGLSGVEGGGVELVAELNKIASSLALSSASRAFSFLSCLVSLLSCFILCSCCIMRCSWPGSRRQLSVDKNERHRGNDEPEGDVVIGGEQGDLGDHDAGDGLDQALAIEAAVAAERN
jgi:hypothetical protein